MIFQNYVNRIVWRNWRTYGKIRLKAELEQAQTQAMIQDCVYLTSKGGCAEMRRSK